ncbi:MAG: hypothetical protein AAFW84_25260 [Cyanobacteria bacterium J06635_15]
MTDRLDRIEAILERVATQTEQFRADMAVISTQQQEFRNEAKP